MTKPLVLSFGELLWDMLPDGPVLGGAPANFSANLSNLGISTALISCVGKDRLGDEALKQLERIGINLDYIQRTGTAPTGTVDVQMNSEGSPSYKINTDVAYDHIQPCEYPTAIFEAVRLVCFGTLIQRSAVAQAALANLLQRTPNALKLLDINLRPDCFSASTVGWSLKQADILKLNDTEVLELSRLLSDPPLRPDAFCEFIFSNYGIQTILITKGAAGVFARARSGEVVELLGCKVDVVDTIGAGDAFTAGFVFRLLAGDSLRNCCEFGNRLGAFIAGKKGGIVAYNQADLSVH